MNATLRNCLLVIMLILSIILLPVITGTGILELPNEDDDPIDPDGDDFSMITNPSLPSIRIPVSQLSILLKVGISIFALFIVYLGGRSKHRRFNDRTIDPVNLLKANILKTALSIRGAVFYFLLSDFRLHYTSNQLGNRFKSIVISLGL